MWPLALSSSPPAVVQRLALRNYSAPIVPQGWLEPEHVGTGVGRATWCVWPQPLQRLRSRSYSVTCGVIGGRSKTWWRIALSTARRRLGGSLRIELDLLLEHLRPQAHLLRQYPRLADDLTARLYRLWQDRFGRVDRRGLHVGQFTGKRGMSWMFGRGCIITNC